MYILDTNVVSDFRRQRPSQNLLRWISTIDSSEIFMSVLTIFEIQVGIERARRSDAEVARRVEEWLVRMLEIGEPHVLSVDADTARLQGKMWETPALKVFTITDPRAKDGAKAADLGIAATAITNEAVLVTGNVKDFLLINDHFPLPGLYDPFKDEWIVKPQSSPSPSSP